MVALICLIALLSSFFYRQPSCYGDFSTAYNAADAAHSSDIARCSYAFAQGTCIREADLSFNNSVNTALRAWEDCIDRL